MDQTNRYDRDIAGNRDSLKMIANTINKRLQTKLTKPEVADLIQFVRNHRTQNWGTLSVSEICHMLARTYLSSRFTDSGRANLDTDYIDMHEVMKARVASDDQETEYEYADNVDANGTPMAGATAIGTGAEGALADGSTLGAISKIETVGTLKQVTSVGNVAGILGKTDEVSFQQMINPQAAYRKNYIYLDSRYRDTSSDTAGMTAMKWNFLSNMATSSMGGVASVGNVQQVVAISTGTIRLPYQDNMLDNSYKRVSMLINEWSGQAYIGQEGRKFHFMFKTSLDSNMVDCEPHNSDRATFEFAKPITQIDTITISFGAPLESIAFDRDRMGMSVSYSNPLVLSSTNPHKLRTGDKIHISGFTTDNPTADAAVIARVNNERGYNCRVLSETTVEIAELDLSALAAPINPLIVQVFFGSKRIFVPIELTYIAST
jgi:hypothetical protein